MQILPAWLASRTMSVWQTQGKERWVFLPMFHSQNPRQGFQLAWFGSQVHPWANHSGQKKGYYAIGGLIKSQGPDEGRATQRKGSPIVRGSS